MDTIKGERRAPGFQKYAKPGRILRAPGFQRHAKPGRVQRAPGFQKHAKLERFQQSPAAAPGLYVGGWKLAAPQNRAGTAAGKVANRSVGLSGAAIPPDSTTCRLQRDGSPFPCVKEQKGLAFRRLSP